MVLDNVSWGRYGVLALAGQHQQATREAEAWLRSRPRTAEALKNLACVVALAAGAVRADKSLASSERKQLAEGYAERAVKLLDQARAAGYFRSRREVENLKADTDLDPVRARPDFQVFWKSVGADHPRTAPRPNAPVRESRR